MRVCQFRHSGADLHNHVTRAAERQAAPPRRFASGSPTSMNLKYCSALFKFADQRLLRPRYRHRQPRCRRQQYPARWSPSRFPSPEKFTRDLYRIAWEDVWMAPEFAFRASARCNIHSADMPAIPARIDELPLATKLTLLSIQGLAACANLKPKSRTQRNQRLSIEWRMAGHRDSSAISPFVGSRILVAEASRPGNCVVRCSTRRRRETNRVCLLLSRKQVSGAKKKTAAPGPS